MPQKLQRVLVPLDGSPMAERALGQAVAMARPFDAEIILLRVLEASSANGNCIDTFRWRLARAEAQSYLESRAQRLRARGVRASTQIAEGRAADEIVKAVREQEIDLVVFCTHGGGRANRFDLGSTAAKVAALAAVSVLLVRGRGPEDEPAEAPEEARYRRILVPLDGSHRAEWALHLAAGIARSHGAELLMVRVLPAGGRERQAAPTPEEQARAERLAARERRAAEEYLHRMRDRLAVPGLVVRELLTTSRHVAQGLHEVARQEEADLIVMSAHGASGAAPWPHGSVTMRLIQHGELPLLVFQDLPPRSLDRMATEGAKELPEAVRTGAR